MHVRERGGLVVGSGLAGKHNEVKRLLGLYAALHFFPGFEVGREGGMERKQEENTWPGLGRSGGRRSLDLGRESCLMGPGSPSASQCLPTRRGCGQG